MKHDRVVPPRRKAARPVRQVAAVPCRADADGALEILLVTSRRTRRWIVPKGWPMAGLADWEAAAREAWEEAGVRGAPDPEPIGAFDYAKRLDRRRAAPARVTVFRLEVAEECADWPERAQRERRWLPLAEAAALLDDEGLAALLLTLG